ncbi:MAG: thioesterase family protein [Acidimicrobiia bacterium]
MQGLELLVDRSAVIRHVVAEGDTSAAMGTSDVAVLSTPRVILLAERAVAAVLEGRIEAGMSAVEHRVEISHVAPTRVGTPVQAEATLEAVDGRRLVFRVTVSDERGLVAAGRFTRVVVATDRFMENAQPSA